MNLVDYIIDYDPKPRKLRDPQLFILLRMEEYIELYTKSTLLNNNFSYTTYYLFELIDAELYNLVISYKNSITQVNNFCFSYMADPIKLITLKFLKYCFLHGYLKSNHEINIFDNGLLNCNTIIDTTSNIIYQLNIILEKEVQSKSLNYIKFSYHKK